MSTQRKLYSILPILFVSVLFPTAIRAQAPKNIQGILAQNCLECHGEGADKGLLRLDTLKFDLAKPETFRNWVRIYDRVEKGEMPPRDFGKLPEDQRKPLLASLKTELTNAEKNQPLSLVRRLNRVEYEHTLQDLLALPTLRVKELLPEDGQQHGFDKVTGALDISPVHMAKYLQVADHALRQAIVRQIKAPETKAWREAAAKQYSAQSAIAVHCAVPLVGHELAPGLKTHLVGNPVKDFGNSYRAATFKGEADSVALLTGVIGAHQPEGLQIDRFNPPIGGWYRVKFSTWSLRWERTKAVSATRGLVRNYAVFGAPNENDETEKRFKATPLPEEKAEPGWKENVEFYGEGEATHVVRASLKGKAIGYFDAPSLKPKTHEFKIWLNPGERISFHAMTLPATGAKNSGANNGIRTYEGPGVAFDWFDVEGPIIDQWPSESQRRLFGEIPINAYPRPPIKGIPTIEPGETVKLVLDKFKGAGQMLGTERLLNVNGTATGSFNAAAPGTYEIVVTASETSAGDVAAQMRLLRGGQPIPQASFAVDSPRKSPKSYRAKLSVENAGPIELGIEFQNDFLDEKNPDPMRRDRNLFVAEVQVIGPSAKSTPVPAKSTPDLRLLVRSFAERAFRRPVTQADVEPYLSLIVEQSNKGQSMEEAVLAGYKAILCSPDFLFVGLEGDESDAKNKTAYTLASKLSYFLWNSMPDQTLLELAAKGELHKPAIRKAQVERMLNDPRSDRFIEHFLDEWLEMKKIDFTSPDPQLYPDFDPWLRDSMLEETRGTFRKLLAENLGVSQIIQSDFVLINQRLAELYGIRGVIGADFRSVKVPNGTPRGGFLTQAAVLRVTANGTATSPVLRGVWVTERILGIPRNPPPPNIPAVEPDATGAVTIRQMIEKHRADRACASCHAIMDPPGMALENFDVIGGWRDRYRLSGQPKKMKKGKELIEEPSIEIVSDAGLRHRVKLRLGSKVDASGELEDGRKFDDLAGLQKLFLKDEDQLARNLLRQLTIYATGAGFRFSDRETIDAMVARTRNDRHGLRTLVHEVVQSGIFASVAAP